MAMSGEEGIIKRIEKIEELLAELKRFVEEGEQEEASLISRVSTSSRGPSSSSDRTVRRSIDL